MAAYAMNSAPTLSSGDEIGSQPKTVPFCHREIKPILACPGEWVRPLGHLESSIEVAGRYGSLNTVQAIWLCSTHTLNSSDVHQALLQIAEKMHILQLCVQRRGLKMWFKRMKEVICEFEVEEGDVMAIFHEELQKKSYDFVNGPLWRAKLVFIPRQSPEDPHLASLIFSAHHCIVDGHTIMQIFRTFLELLNAALTRRDYDVPVYPVIPSVTDILWTKSDWKYLFTYFCSKMYSRVFTNYNNKVFFNGALKQPQTRTPLTKILRKNFTVSETKELIRYCKEAGVTVHCCIMAAANLALLKTVQQRATFKVEAVKINTVNSVSTRRYFPDELKASPGCHISLEEKERLITDSSAKSKEEFWSLANAIQADLNDCLNVQYIPLRNTPLLRVTPVFLYLNRELTRRGRKIRADSHFNTTNMGNLKDKLPARYEGPVEIWDMLRSGTNAFNGNPFTLTFHTFDDRFMVSVNYYTNMITTEDAELFFSNFEQYISNIMRYGGVHVS